MATYAEIHDFLGNNVLINRVSVGIIVAADLIMNESDATPNHINRLIWARSAFVDAQKQAKYFLSAMLAANNTATIQQITDSTDTQIQNNVNAVINIFAGA